MKEVSRFLRVVWDYLTKDGVGKMILVFGGI